ncbi:hypothetical protein LguiA_002218 [Lonicera macranthoides]
MSFEFKKHPPVMGHSTDPSKSTHQRWSTLGGGGVGFGGGWPSQLFENFYYYTSL